MAPSRSTWTIEQLLTARAIALEHAVAKSTAAAYSTAVASYKDFCSRHAFDLEPTPHTLSLFVVWSCHFISPRSVDSYLSGVCNNLESFYPTVREARKSFLVRSTLEGCKRLKNKPIKRKRALEPPDLTTVIEHFSSSSNHDDRLFVALLLVGFAGLHRLGELVWPDRVELRSWRNIILRSSLEFQQNSFSYMLPGSKADRFFEGNKVYIFEHDGEHNPLPHFTSYLQSRDALFPGLPELWLTSSGEVPVRSWFIQRLRMFFPKDISGHSMRSGGATALAIAGVPDSRIQAAGRWSSDAFQAYIRKNPLMIHALIHGQHSLSS
jgi:hypothetical protein